MLVFHEQIKYADCRTPSAQRQQKNVYQLKNKERKSV